MCMNFVKVPDIQFNLYFFSLQYQLYRVISNLSKTFTKGKCVQCPNNESRTVHTCDTDQRF